MPRVPAVATETVVAANDSPFDPRIPVIRAGSPEFAALTLATIGVK